MKETEPEDWNAEEYFSEKAFFERVLEAIAPPLDAPLETRNAFQNALEDIVDAMN